MEKSTSCKLMVRSVKMEKVVSCRELRTADVEQSLTMTYGANGEPSWYNDDADETQSCSEITANEFTFNELMVVAAAREIKDGEIVFVGMRLPLIAFVVAKKTHAPNAVGLFENGVIRTTPSPELIYTMADPPNIKGATQCLDMAGLMGMLQSGRVNLGFLGAAEVDKHGNLNSTQVQGRNGLVRLPGSGGACDIAFSPTVSSLFWDTRAIVCLRKSAISPVPEG